MSDKSSQALFISRIALIVASVVLLLGAINRLELGNSPVHAQEYTPPDKNNIRLPIITDTGITRISVFPSAEDLLSIDHVLSVSTNSLYKCTTHNLNTRGHADVTFQIPDNLAFTVCMQDLASMLFTQLRACNTDHVLKIHTGPYPDQDKTIYTLKKGKLVFTNGMPMACCDGLPTTYRDLKLK